MEKTQQQLNANPDAYEVAIVASARLRTALGRHRLTLPSLRAGAPTVIGEPHVELGGCSAALAEQLADILELIEPAAADR